MFNKFWRFLQPGMLQGLIFQSRLILRLLRDRRVNFFIKLIPIATLAYLVLPDFIPLRIDDFIVFTLGMDWFVKLSPKEVVQEHSDRLKGLVTA